MNPCITFIAGVAVCGMFILIVNGGFHFDSESENNIAVGDVTKFVISQQHQIDEMNKTIEDLNQQVDKLKSNDYYQKYTDLKDEKDKGSLIFSLLSLIFFIFCLVIISIVIRRSVRRERKELEEQRELLETNITKKLEKEEADKIGSLHDEIQTLRFNLQIKDKEHEIECIKCKNKV